MTFLKMYIAKIISKINKKKRISNMIVNKPNKRDDIFLINNEARLEHQ